MTDAQKVLWEEWLATRPPEVVRAAREFPLATTFPAHDGTLLYVVGYREDGSLLVSDINPAMDYDRAIATRRPVCKCCVRKLQVRNQ